MALTAGALTQVSVTDVGDVLASAVAVSGTTPYTYQWYRSTSNAFTPGTTNLVSGATSLNLSDSALVPSTTYYYKVISTDAAGTPATATSSQLSVTTLQSQAQLPLSDVVTVQVAAVQQGVGAYNTSNLALFTRDTTGSTFPTTGYGIYLSPTQVGTDFGTTSNTYKMAVAVFSQQPNILLGGGYLAIIPFLTAAQTAVQTVAFSAVAASGTFTLSYNSVASAAINWNDTASQIQTKLQAVTLLGQVTVSGSIAAKSLVVTFVGVSGAAALLVVGSNTVKDASVIAITITPATTTIGSTAETLDAAINRTQGLVQYFGVMSAEIPIQSVMLAAAAVIQSLNKLAFFTSYTQADVAVGGMLDLLRSGTLTQSRAVPYFETVAASQPTTSLQYMAGYAGRGLSVNFNGSLTTITMNGKTISGSQPDPSMTPTLFALCQAAGADVYANVQGVAKVMTSGLNDYFDNQYNIQWFVGALQVAGANALLQTSTKVPQTEDGMNILKGAYRSVCEQAVANQFLAPGSWTSSTMFGNVANLVQNIAQRGYYIYSSPVSQQLAAVRALRQAPLVQLAIKYAGAIHSSSLVINVNT